MQHFERKKRIPARIGVIILVVCMLLSVLPPIALAADVNFARYSATICVDGEEITSEQVDPGVISANAVQTRPNGAVYQKAVVRTGTGTSIKDVEITSASGFEGNTYYAFENDPDTGIKLADNARIVLIYNTKYTVTYDITNAFPGTERRVSTRGCPTELWKGEDLNLTVIPDKYYVVASAVASIDGYGEVPITFDHLGKATVPANIINGNVTVRLEIAKPASFAVKEARIAVEKDGIQHGDLCEQCSSGGSSIYTVAPGATAKFYIYSQAWSGGDQWYLNQLEINGEDVFVPRSYDPAKLNSTSTTTLANGSIVTIKLITTDGRDDHINNSRRCKYEVTVTDVQNDIVLTGNFKEGGRREVILKGLTGISRSGMAKEDTRYEIFPLPLLGWHYDYSLQETLDNVYRAYYKEGGDATSYNIFVYDVVPGYNPWTITYGGYGVGELYRGPETIAETVAAMNTNFRHFEDFQAQSLVQGYKYSFMLRENDSYNQQLFLNAVPYEFSMRFNLDNGTLDEAIYEEDYYLDKSTNYIVEKQTYTAINGGEYAYTPGFTPTRANRIFTGWKLVGDPEPTRVFGSSEAFFIDPTSMEIALANSTNPKANSQGFTFVAQWDDQTGTTYVNYEVVYLIEVPSSGTISYNETRYNVFMTQTKVGKVGDTVIAFGTNNPNPLQYELNTSISRMVTYGLLPFSNGMHTEHNRLILYYDLRGDYLNTDVDGDGIPDLNIDVDGDGIPDFNIVTNHPGRPSLNIAPGYEQAYNKKTGTWDLSLIKATINIDVDGDGRPDVNIDIDGDGIPDMNVDTDGDGIPDEYVDTNGDGVPDTGIIDRTEGLMFHPVTVTINGGNATTYNLFSGPIRDFAPEIWNANPNWGLYKAVVRKNDNPATDFEIEYTACYSGVVYYSVSADDIGLTKLASDQKVVLLYRTAYSVTYQPLVGGFTGGGNFGKSPKVVFTGEDLIFNVYPEKYHDVTSVKYRVGSGATLDATKNADGSYRIPSNVITGNVTITANFTQRTSYTITDDDAKFTHGDLCTCAQSDQIVPAGGTASFEISSFDWDVPVIGDVGRVEYYLLRLDINGENIEIPKSNEPGEMQSKATTTLKNGSVVTVELIKAGSTDPCNRDNSYGWPDTEYRRIFRITVTDVKADIRINGEFCEYSSPRFFFGNMTGIDVFRATKEVHAWKIWPIVPVTGTHYDYTLQAANYDTYTFDAYNAKSAISGVESRSLFFYSAKPGFNPWSVFVDGDKSLDAGVLMGPYTAGNLINRVENDLHHIGNDIKTLATNGTATHGFELEWSQHSRQIVYMQLAPYQYSLRFKLGTGTITDDELNAVDYRRGGSGSNAYVSEREGIYYTLKDGAVKIPVLTAVPKSSEGGFVGWKLERDASPGAKIYQPGELFTLDENSIAFEAAGADMTSTEGHSITFVPVFDPAVPVVEYGAYEIRSYVQDPNGTVLVKLPNGKYNAYSLAKEPVSGLAETYRVVVGTDRVNPNAAKYVLNEDISKMVIDYVDPISSAHYGLLPLLHPQATKENVLIYYYDLRYSSKINEHTDGDGVPDVNIDSDGDGIADINIDSDGDGIPDINLFPGYATHYNKVTQLWDATTVPILNLDTNGTGTWRPSKNNVDDDGIWNPDRNLDVNGNGTAADLVDYLVNPLPVVDANGDGVDDNWANAISDARSVAGQSGTFKYETGDPTLNADTDGDGKPDINIDTDGDGDPDINIDTDGDGKPDINIDTDGDKKPDVNVDVDGDDIADINIDTNGDGIPDVNVIPDIESKYTDTNGNGAIDRDEIPSTLTPEINIDTDGTGTWAPSGDGGNDDGIWLPDRLVDTDGDGEPDLGTDAKPWYRDPIDKDNDGVDDVWEDVVDEYGVDLDNDGKYDYTTGDPRIDYGLEPVRPEPGTPPGPENPWKDVGDETVIILRGDWANESTFKPAIKDNTGTVVTCDWSVVTDSWIKHNFNSAAVSVSADGTITVLKSGITTVRGLYKGSEIEFTVIVPGDYNRSNAISGTDATTVMQLNAEAIELDSRLFSLELADMNRNNVINGTDGTTIRSINAEQIFIVKF